MSCLPGDNHGEPREGVGGTFDRLTLSITATSQELLDCIHSKAQNFKQEWERKTMQNGVENLHGKHALSEGGGGSPARHVNPPCGTEALTWARHSLPPTCKQGVPPPPPQPHPTGPKPSQPPT